MLYDSTKSLLRGMLQRLEAADKTTWDDQIESAKECLYEMHQMSRPSYRAYRTDGLNSKSTAHVPVAEKLHRAMPHVKTMASAIRRRDQATAIESGRAALAEM